MIIAIYDSAFKYNLDTPYVSPLGGTQSAICYFLEEIALQGHDVYLYNNNDDNKIIRNVKHINKNVFKEYTIKNNIKYDILIVSCLVHDLFQIKNVLNSPETMYCLWTGHDIDQQASKLLDDNKARDMVDLFMFVSNWQRDRYCTRFNINSSKTMILRNGIGKPFEKYLNEPLNKTKNTSVYCSIPWRGLDLTVDIFNNIKQNTKDYTLDIYSGMNIYGQNDSMDMSKFNVNGISYNKGVSQSELAHNLSKIEYLTYPNIFPETSCITALQAMACGCLVVTSNLGALKESMGGLNEYVDINLFEFDKNRYVSEFVSKVNSYINMNESIKNTLREANKSHIRNNYLWSDISKKFLVDASVLLNKYRNYVRENHKKLLELFIKKYNESAWNDCIIINNNLKYTININEFYLIKINLAICFYKLNQLEEAKKYFKICSELKNDYNVNKNIALLELQRGDIKKFIKYTRNALTHSYDLELANLLAEKYEMLGMYDFSTAVYETIIYLDPNNINCHNNLGNLNLLKIAHLDDIDKNVNDIYLKALQLCDKNNQHRKKELVLSNIIFNNLYNWTMTDETVFKKSCIWYDYFPKDDKLVQLVSTYSKNNNNTNSHPNKIRVGYMSCDFITHPVGFMFNSILKNHNTDEFEIFCYDCCDTGKKINDSLSAVLRNYKNAEWRNLSDTTDEEALKIICNDNLDILVDMMGHTRNTRMNVLQYKPATIQISYFAYPSTNGLKEIDYRFTDKYATPPETQKYFVEKLYYLPNGFQCYTPPENINATKDYTRNKYTIHLCCFNNPIKLSIPTIDTFCKILKQLPEAKLFLRYCYYKSSYYRKMLMKLFLDRGIEEERIDIGYNTIVDALKNYNKIDIALDPFPYNGGTVSSEALYMNTPIVTLEGTTYVSRVGVSLLSNLNLENLIAKTPDEYVSKVVELARNEKELKLLHQTLRLKMLKTDLGNSISFTKNIEAAYKDIYLEKIVNG